MMVKSLAGISDPKEYFSEKKKIFDQNLKELKERISKNGSAMIFEQGQWSMRIEPEMKLSEILGFNDKNGSNKLG